MRALLAQSAQAVVDAQGVATIRMAPQGEDWEITRLTVKVSTKVLEAEASYYLTNISADALQEATQMGSTGDTTDTNLTLTDGDPLWVRWTGADVGAMATVTIRGWRTQPVGGFRAVPAGGRR